MKLLRIFIRGVNESWPRPEADYAIWALRKIRNWFRERRDMKTRERFNLLNSYSLPYTNPERVPIDRNQVGPFVEGYVECALWTTDEDRVWGDGSPLSDNYTIFNLDEPTLLQMIRDCVYFYWHNAAKLEALYKQGYTQRDAGHDFWLSRNGHGAGFFDRGFEDVWDELQQFASTRFRESHLWVNEIGEVAEDMSEIVQKMNRGVV